MDHPARETFEVRAGVGLMYEVERVLNVAITKQRLKMLRLHRKELELLEKQLLKLQKEITFFRDFNGQEDEARLFREAAGPRLDVQKQLYLQRKHLIEEEICELVGFIDRIPDCLLRQAFTLRHLDGLTWQQVANRIGIFSADTIRITHNRYLEQEAHRLDEHETTAG